MNLCIRQLSSLIKLRNEADLCSPEIRQVTLLRGEHFSYQIGISSDEGVFSSLELRWDLKKQGKAVSEKEVIRTYVVQDTVMDYPAYPDHDEDILTAEPGMMPDLLIPAEDRNLLFVCRNPRAFWVDLTIPEDADPGPITLKAKIRSNPVNSDLFWEAETVLLIRVLPECLPEQTVHATQWFHTDCIAEAHRVPLYSEEHWELIGKYMDTARYYGLDTILVPVLTPALDTRIGYERLSTQLLGITKKEGKYEFDFRLLDRFIRLTTEKCFQKLEISHLFSQWGLSCPPNIYVTEEGRTFRMFGWGVDGHGEEYYDFLRQMLPCLTEHLKEIGVLEKCVFHLSDEPSLSAFPNYQKAGKLVRPLLQGCPTMDALSNPDFYDAGCVDYPVTASNHIEPFLERKIEDQWIYYCCGQYHQVANRFFNMPSRRNRIMGIQMFRYDIKGFLQWGFNFYHSRVSGYYIDPLLSSSADRSFPSGDAYSVYPGPEGPLMSLRGLVFKDALEDIRILQLAADRYGRERIYEIIDEEAGGVLTFRDYPRNDEFILNLMERIKGML